MMPSRDFKFTLTKGAAPEALMTIVVTDVETQLQVTIVCPTEASVIALEFFANNAYDIVEQGMAKAVETQAAEESEAQTDE